MRFPLAYSNAQKKYFTEHVWLNFIGAVDLELAGVEKILPNVYLGFTQSLYRLSSRRNSPALWENHLYYAWGARPWDYAPQAGKCIYQIILALRKLISGDVKSLCAESDDDAVPAGIFQ